jgi:uncharacterized protein YecT (DUF1311 family)
VRLGPVAFIIAAALSLSPALVSIAAEPPNVDRYYSKTYSDCMVAAGGATYPTIDCIASEHDAWDKEMNQLYLALISVRSAPDRMRLRDEQRAWLRRETARCDHAGDDEAGGSLQRVEIDQCYLDETLRRTLYLGTLR